VRVPPYEELPKTAKGNVGSAWGLFGDDDSLGLMNLQTPERIAAAARLVKRGSVFALNAPVNAIDPPMFGRGTPRHTVFRTPSGGADDVIDNLYPQASSQWDSLGHASFERNVFYNGRTVDDVLAGKNTIDHWARRGIAGRAILLDVARVYAERGRPYSPGEPVAIAVDDLEAARAIGKVDFAPGDVILLHTGFLAWYERRSAETKAAIAPRGALQAVGIEGSEAMARYLWNTHACAIGADNPAIEVRIADRSTLVWPWGNTHNMLIAQFGFALGELWSLDALAADCARDGVYEMFFTAAPFNMAGGIGSPANALAIK
jgi:kynurenine formamidase